MNGPSNPRRSSGEWSQPVRRVRAFTVEWDSRIFQHVDTKDGAKETRDYAYNSIHIEFAAREQPLTNDQIFYGADLMAWIASQHPNVRLITVGGDSNKEPGDLKQRG